MAKQFNNKILFIVFALLLGIFLITMLLDRGKSQRSFREDMTGIDTAKISAILVYPSAEGGKEVRLERNGNDWHVVRGEFRALADRQSVISLLPQVATMKVKRLAATSKDKWKEFEVTDSLGTRVKVLDGKKTMADLIIGKFSVNQQARTFTNFVREASETEVYAVDGFLSMTFNRDLNSWRDKTFLKVTQADLTKVQLQSEEGQKSLQKSENEWLLNGQPADSASVAGYLSGLTFVNGANFADQYQPGAPNSSVRIEGNNMLPVEIKLYEDGNGGFVLNSSMNPKAYFSSDSTGIYAKVFKDLLNLGPVSE